MKRHVALKFIAIALCAAALLGAVASGAGVAVLMNFDLYEKTVDEVYQESQSSHSRWFAQDAAQRYADVALGNCPPEFLDQQYDVSGYFTPESASFEVLDAEGNVLPAQQTLTENGVWPTMGPAKPGSSTYSFDIPAGKYKYVVSTRAVSETEPTEPRELGEPVDSETAVPAETEGPITLMVPEEVRDEIAPVPEEVAPEAAPAEEPVALSEEADVEPAPQQEEAEPVQEEPAEDQGAAEEAPAEEEPAGEAPSEEEETAEEEAAEEEEPAEEEPPEEPVPEEETAPQETAAPETVPPVVETVPPTEAPTEPSPEEIIKQYEHLDENQPVLIDGKPLDEYQLYTGFYYDHLLDDSVEVTYVLLNRPACTVQVHLLPEATGGDIYLPMLRTLRANRGLLLPVLAVSLLAFAVLAVYLCCVAGRKPRSEEVRAGGLNRIPLELYFLAAGCVMAVFAVFLAEGGINVLMRRNTQVALAATAGLGYAACLSFVGFCFAAAAQLKTPGRFWLKNSLCGHCLRLLVWAWHLLLNTIVWLARLTEKKILPLLGRMLGRLWRGFKKICCEIGAGAQRLLDLLPLTWQWLVVCFVMLFLFLIAIAAQSMFLLILVIFASIAAILYGSHAFGLLLEAARRMSKGDLHAKVDEKLLIGCFRDFALTLNALANVAVVAAQKQLKSERMKTELITNVSHDIKTPLTSIISYADLLQKPHTPEEEAQYLEVLGRQSMQLKKLIEDLIEMSKASTGNMTVDITRVDAVEAMNQALGEFADKLDAAALTPVFRHSDDTAPMMADGKLVWRVLHNLLSNAVKYALPGTRLYIDMLCLEGKVILSMKNVSRDELNVDAEELMERFVRGDDSRNTEGSGLGLNIAKSMMELQHGSLQLLVDGDLFKVTLIFPGA